MEIIPEFKKDLSSNYMILCPLKTKEDSFLIKMLARNHIDGLLKIEIKIVDNKRYYYYDITGKQTLYDIIEKSPISFVQLEKIYSKLLQLPDICREFLIDENGIFIEPNFIYIDASFDIEFCYYPGMDQELQEQIGKITEYLLNRVDYKDEQAVLAVYALYQVSHDKNCTLEKLKDVFEHQCRNIDRERKELNKRKSDKKELEGKEHNREKKNFSQERDFKTENLQEEYRNENKKQKEENIIQEKTEEGGMKSRIKKLDINMEYNKKNEREMQKQLVQKEKKEQKNKVEFPYMEERIENQKEVLTYQKKLYMEAVFILIFGLAVLFILMKSGILSINGKPDSKRCIIAVVCYISILFVAFLIIFRKENRVTKIEENIDYIDWEEDYDSLPMPEIYGLTVSEPIEKNYYQEAFLKETGNNSSFGKNLNEEDTETELLVDFFDHSIAYLESEFSGERIYLKKFPFLIGKLRKGTDYVLENNKISRVHAKFDYDESHHYIEDMDSTNGTIVNGTPLLAHDRTILFNGDRVCLADKNFIFHC